MSKSVRYLALTGPLQGYTGNKGGIHFTRGIAEVSLGDEEWLSLKRYFERSYKCMEVQRGFRYPDKNGAERAVSEVQGEVPEAEQAVQEGPVHGEADDDAQPGDEGLQADGDGQERPPAQEVSSIRLRELIATLPRDNDENWTSDGRPRVDAVSRMAGRDVTRKEINLAMGSDFVR